jgi:succinyl-CoA synthetase beta subunit
LKLLEYEAKEIFRTYGIPTPIGYMVTNVKDATIFTKEIGKPVVVKAQLPVGGRGKAGGIKFADSPQQASEVSKELFNMKVNSLEVTKLLIEEKIHIINEVYLGITVDRQNKQHVVLASTQGGVDIEVVANKTPEKINRHSVDPIMGLRSYHANLMAKKLGFSGRKMRQFGNILINLYKLAMEMDAELTEINPLAEINDGFIAVDARLNIDNNALFRHEDFKEKLIERSLGDFTEKEIEARKNDLIYVELEGNIGIIGNGAGLTMATLDTVILHGGKAANFLDLGGGATAERIEKAVVFVLNDARTKVLFVNILGGITRCDHTATGIVEARDKLGINKPIVVRLMGTNEEEGRIILQKAGIDTFNSMEEAASLAVLLAGEN